MGLFSSDEWAFEEQWYKDRIAELEAENNKLRALVNTTEGATQTDRVGEQGCDDRVVAG